MMTHMVGVKICSLVRPKFAQTQHRISKAEQCNTYLFWEIAAAKLDVFYVVYSRIVMLFYTRITNYPYMTNPTYTYIITRRPPILA